MIALLLAACLGLQDDADVDAAVVRFKTAFKSTSPNERANAISELGKTPHAKTMALIVPLLTNDLPVVRQAAAKALGKFVDQKKTVLQALTHALIGNAADSNIVRTILWSLGELGDASAAPTLQKYFYDKDSRVALYAIQIGALLPAVSSIDPLIDILKRQEKIVKNNSASGSVLAGGDVNGNNKVVAKSDENVLKMAEDMVKQINVTLSKISGESLTGSQDWQTWWNQARSTFKLPQ